VTQQSKMFDCVTSTYNPLGGECPHDCTYCWVKILKRRYPNLQKKYSGPPRLIPKELKRQFKPDEFVFVQDMSDLFADNVPSECIQTILDYIRKFPNTWFLLLTKNPKRYHQFNIPLNCICGATIETNRWKTYDVSKADLFDRIYWMTELNHIKMVSIEPVMDFDVDEFFVYLIAMCFKGTLKFVYLGLDNYNTGLIPPPHYKIVKLVEKLGDTSIEVRLKPSIQQRREEVTR